MKPKKKKRKLEIVDAPDESQVKHAGRELAGQICRRIMTIQAQTGMLHIEGHFWTAFELLEQEVDPIEALTYYGSLTEWVDTMVSRQKHKSQQRLAEFLESRP